MLLRCAPVRYLILGLGTLFLSMLLGCLHCFNPAITVMMDLASSPLYNSSNSSGLEHLASWTIPIAQRRFAYSNWEKSLLLASNYGTTLALVLPVGWAMQRYGALRTQALIGAVVSIATGLIPLAASLHFYALLALRMLSGLAGTNLFPVVGAICTAWAPAREKGVFIALLSGYVQLSVILTMPLAGLLLDHFGWPWVFFVHSAVTLLLSLLWTLFYRDSPDEHRWLDKRELALLRTGNGHTGAQQTKPPYRRMFCSVPVWAVLCAVVGNFLAIHFANTFLPMFLVTALHFSNSQTGLLSALPLVIQFLVKWITGYLTDHLQSVSNISKVRFCNSIAFFGAALFFSLAALLPPSSSSAEDSSSPAIGRLPSVACLNVAIGILGMNSGGFYRSAVLHSAQFSSVVMVGVQTVLNLTIFVGSFVVPAMTAQGGLFWEYARVFLFYAAALVLTNIVFVSWCAATPAEWARTVSGDGAVRNTKCRIAVEK